MCIINHSEAVELERQVKKLFKCERFGVFGLVNADNFESRPLDAAIMVMSYICAKGLETKIEIDSSFWTKYKTILTYPKENELEQEVKNYIGELTGIIGKCLEFTD